MTEPRTKKDYAVEAIRSLILEGELDPGERLRQADLAARLKISLTPVREALRQLEAEGVVAGTAHRGVRVRGIELTELRSVYLSRRLIEPYLAGRGVLNVGPTHVGAARTSLEQLAGAQAQENAVEVRRANYEFHFGLYEQADTPLLIDTARTLWTRFPWDVLSVVPERRQSSVLEHARILDAMARADADGVAEACALHLTRSYLDIERYLGGDSLIADPFPFDGLRAVASA